MLSAALPTLELHSILRRSRSKGGGLIVATPNPDYTVKLALTCLRHSALPRHCFYRVWKVLQLAAAQEHWPG